MICLILSLFDIFKMWSTKTHKPFQKIGKGFFLLFVLCSF